MKNYCGNGNESPQEIVPERNKEMISKSKTSKSNFLKRIANMFRRSKEDVVDHIEGGRFGHNNVK